MNLSMEDEDNNTDRVIYPIEEPWEEPAPADTSMSLFERLCLAALAAAFLAMALWVVYGMGLLGYTLARLLWRLL